MNIVWDEPKRIANLDKHGLDFAAVNDWFFDSALIGPATHGRYKAIGEIEGIVCVIFAVLGTEAVSIISFRPASKKERNRYANG